MNDLLLRVLNKQPVPRTPIWIMRQAGRYLPEYRAVREKHDFLTMVHTPEIAAEITLQPIKRFGFDAAIIFSDILVIPQAMGMPLQFHEGRGPVFDAPLRDLEKFEQVLHETDRSILQPTLDAIRIVCLELDGRTPLIGFAGAPWTLAAYMIEGSGSKSFRYAKAALYQAPDKMHALLDKLSSEISNFLLQQIEAGAQVVQIFDSWAGQLTPEQFYEFVLPYLTKIVESIAPTNTPVIVFARGAGHSLRALLTTGAQALGIDWQTDMTWAKKCVDDNAVVQGNLDPTALYAPVAVLKKEVIEILEKVGENGQHIFNLGHGILPDVPVDNVHALVEILHDVSPAFHNQNATFSENNYSDIDASALMPEAFSSCEDF
ncbi:MAG: uroporphyrinogen decarboxylase [bacterium]